MHADQYQSAGPSSTPYSTSAASAEPVTHRDAVTAKPTPTGITRTTESVPGRGRVVLDVSGSDAMFSSLAYSYPLKLLSPRCTHPHVGVAYLLSYGGGLVGGDEIIVDVHVRRGAHLVLLTQVGWGSLGLLPPFHLTFFTCRCLRKARSAASASRSRCRGRVPARRRFAVSQAAGLPTTSAFSLPTMCLRSRLFPLPVSRNNRSAC